MDGIVDAPVAGVEAPQQGGVGRVDDGVHPQPGDVPLPEDQAGVGLGGDQGIPVHHPLLRRLGGEEGVLGRQKVRVQGHGRPQVHQAAQEPPLGPLLPGKPLSLGPVLGHLRQQDLIQGLDLF